jgi:hypothetical protein
LVTKNFDVLFIRISSTLSFINGCTVLPALYC